MPNIRETSLNFSFFFINPRDLKLVKIFENIHEPIELDILKCSSQRRLQDSYLLPFQDTIQSLAPAPQPPTAPELPASHPTGHMAFCKCCGHRLDRTIPPPPETLLIVHISPLPEPPHSLLPDWVRPLPAWVRYR